MNCGKHGSSDYNTHMEIQGENIGKCDGTIVFTIKFILINESRLLKLYDIKLTCKNKN